MYIVLINDLLFLNIFVAIADGVFLLEKAFRFLFLPNIFAHFKKITTFEDTSHDVGPTSKVRSLNAAHTIAIRTCFEKDGLPLKYLLLHTLM